MIYGKLLLHDFSEGFISIFDVLSCLSKYSVVNNVIYIEKDTLLQYFLVEKEKDKNTESENENEKKKENGKDGIISSSEFEDGKTIEHDKVDEEKEKESDNFPPLYHLGDFYKELQRRNAEKRRTLDLQNSTKQKLEDNDNGQNDQEEAKQSIGKEENKRLEFLSYYTEDLFYIVDVVITGFQWNEDDVELARTLLNQGAKFCFFDLELYHLTTKEDEQEGDQGENIKDKHRDWLSYLMDYVYENLLQEEDHITSILPFDRIGLRVYGECYTDGVQDSNGNTLVQSRSFTVEDIISVMQAASNRFKAIIFKGSLWNNEAVLKDMKNYSNVPETEPQFKDSENEKVEEKINEDALKYCLGKEILKAYRGKEGHLNYLDVLFEDEELSCQDISYLHLKFHIDVVADVDYLAQLKLDEDSISFESKYEVPLESILPLKGKASSEEATGTRCLASIFASFLRSDRHDLLYTTVVSDEMGLTLGLVYSNKESILKAIQERRGLYYSRSRAGLWRKGDTSGAIQELVSIHLDCDSDAVLFVVKQLGTESTSQHFCHLSRRNCWSDDSGLGYLQRVLQNRLEKAVEGSYTARLFKDPTLLRNKLLEEAQELAEAESPKHIAEEGADVLYFTMVRLVAGGVSISDVARQLDLRSRKLIRRPGNSKQSRIDAANQILRKKK